MKKDQTRNMVPYPIYPPYQGIAPMMPGMNPMMQTPGMMQYPNMANIMSQNTCSGNNSEISSLKDEIDNLKNRVTYIENAILSNSNINNSNYNSSNYQVM